MAAPTGIDLRSLRSEELESWAALCDEGFGFRDGAAYFLRHFRDDPFADINGIFVAEAGGRLVSSVRVFTREVYLAGRRVTMGGIGEVCTLADYRRQGLSGELLKRAIGYMAARGLDISMLFTGSNGHYARYGWFTVPTRFCRLPLEGVAPIDGVRPMADHDFAAMRGVHGLFAGAADGALVREHPRYWDDWVRAGWKSPIVLERDGRVVAYLDAAPSQHCVRLRDFAQLPGEDALLPLLAAAATVAGCACADVPAPLLSADPQGFVEHTSMMVRLNRPFSLGERTVRRAGDLAALLANAAFFDVDGF
ncbi:MAG: GNAT family N-acetyltransferase [Clostridiales bacterium]|nr:GNAT family N-acetyltransferase [Clostridiales bacterium]